MIRSHRRKNPGSACLRIVGHTLGAEHANIEVNSAPLRDSDEALWLYVSRSRIVGGWSDRRLSVGAGGKRSSDRPELARVARCKRTRRRGVRAVDGDHSPQAKNATRQDPSNSRVCAGLTDPGLRVAPLKLLSRVRRPPGRTQEHEAGDGIRGSPRRRRRTPSGRAGDQSDGPVLAPDRVGRPMRSSSLRRAVSIRSRSPSGCQRAIRSRRAALDRTRPGGR
jgi:hypothetical protein